MKEGLSLIGIIGTSSNCPSLPYIFSMEALMELIDVNTSWPTTVILFDFLMLRPFTQLMCIEWQYRNLTLSVEVSLQRSCSTFSRYDRSFLFPFLLSSQYVFRLRMNLF